MPALEDERLESFAWLIARDFTPLAAALGHAQAPFEGSRALGAAPTAAGPILLGVHKNEAGHR